MNIRIKFYKTLAGMLLMTGVPLISSFNFQNIPDSPIHMNSEGKPEYSPDSLRNKVPDLSFYGYPA